MDLEGQPGKSREDNLASLSRRVADLEREVALLREAAWQSRQTPASLSASAPVETATSPIPLEPVVSSFPESLQAKPSASLENRLGSQVFNRVGIVALLIGVTWFLKLAVDNQWIGPVGRILIGLLAGAGLVLWSERFRRRGFPAFSYSLKAIGSGVLYLSLWAAFQLYHLLPGSVALCAMILVTAWNAFMAWRQDSELLAAYALAGGLATPMLLSTGGNHELFLFTYLLAIDIAFVALVRLKAWDRLMLAAFTATVAYFIGWYSDHFTAAALGLTIVFVAAFFLLFVLPSFRPAIPGSTLEPMPEPIPARASRWSLLRQVFLPLGNAAFGALAMYSVLTDSRNRDLLPWTMLLFAAIYLGITRLKSNPVTNSVHLSLAVVFLTVAIPLKASGAWITVGWLVEGVVLLWTASRLERFALSALDAANGSPRILRLLACGSLLLGFFGVLFRIFEFLPRTQAAFLNARFATALIGIVAFGLAAFIASRLLDRSQPHPTTIEIAGSSVIALNLIAVVSGVTEIHSLWRYTPTSDPEAELQKALAVSAFLMAYGACLLAIGFWKRSAFVRWQALILLVLTILKTFLYDMRNLSQGYRVVSFLGLGVLLMAVSFAYQKDWLNLREPGSTKEPPATQRDHA